MNSLNHTMPSAVAADAIRDELVALAGHVQATATGLTTEDRQFLKDFQRPGENRYNTIGALIRLHRLAQRSPIDEVQRGIQRAFAPEGERFVRPLGAPALATIARESGEAVVALIRDEQDQTPQSRQAARREVSEALTCMWAWFTSRRAIRSA